MSEDIWYYQEGFVEAFVRKLPSQRENIPYVKYIAVSEHPDDIAVDAFATLMKEKLAKARAKGREGWDDPEDCSVEDLAEQFVEHLDKTNVGNFIDLANYLMMLHFREADTHVIKDIL